MTSTEPDTPPRLSFSVRKLVAIFVVTYGVMVAATFITMIPSDLLVTLGCMSTVYLCLVFAEASRLNAGSVVIYGVLLLILTTRIGVRIGDRERVIQLTTGCAVALIIFTVINICRWIASCFRSQPHSPE